MDREMIIWDLQEAADLYMKRAVTREKAIDIILRELSKQSEDIPQPGRIQETTDEHS